MVVLRPEGTHHEPKDVEETAGEEELSRTISIVEHAYRGALHFVSVFSVLDDGAGVTGTDQGVHEEDL